MRNVYWALIAVAVISVLLGIVEHFGGLFLQHIASARAFLWFANTSLLLAIALAVGQLLERQPAQGRAPEPQQTPRE